MTPSTSTRRRLFATALLSALLAATLPAASAGDWSWSRSEPVQGSGNIKREARELGHFTGLSMALPGQVEVHTGNSEGLTIETDDNLLPLIETVVEDGTLKIRNKRNTNLHTRKLKIVVQTRGLDRLAMAGSGDIDCDRVAGNRVRLDVGGSGSIAVRKVEGDSIGVNLGGSGTLKTGDGSARSMSVSIGGSGSVDMARVRVDKASVTVAGSGDATLWVRDSLSMTVAGSGDVNYYGDPQVSKSVVGSGTAHRLGAAPR